MKSSYLQKDVTVLLKDVSGMVEHLDTEVRERKIQGGAHYSEMLPVEYEPTIEYMKIYKEALDKFSLMTAKAAGSVAEKIFHEKGKNVVLVSLARAGTPIGILIKRYLKNKYDIDVCHYTVSIIRGRGIDSNALDYILKYHDEKDIQFVDGWTGKGAIYTELKKDIKQYKNMSSKLAVLADPAWITDLCGTHDDFLIPSSCLNSTVSGLLSRTFLNKDFIGEGDFHGAAYYGDLESQDVSYEFIETVEKFMDYGLIYKSENLKENFMAGLKEAEKIKKEFDIHDINLIKPGVGETTRVLLRRVPWKILVADKQDTQYIGHIMRLAEEKNIEVVQYPLKIYRACGIIKNLLADA